jgi:F-type H+-transporting ATPase subunit b
MNVLATIAVFAAETPGVEAHHPMLPETKELVFGIPAFLIIAGLLIWKALPLAKAALTKRSQGIQQAFDDATARKADAIQKATALTGGIGSSDADAAKIIADAKTQAIGLKASIESQTNDEIAALKERHHSDMASTASQAELDLRTSLSQRALVQAAKVVANLDETTQQKLIQASIAEVAR